jgi:hypothetical protein
MVSRTLALPLLAAALLAATAAGASADSLVAPAPGARNLTANGGFVVWAAPGDPGRWRLTVRAPDGSVTTPAIADFGAPPRAQIGSTGFAVAGRRLLAVYSRCQGASAIAGCDVYGYDLRAGTEEKIAKLSSKTYSETAPSLELGRLAFVRRGGGPTPGLYYYALGSTAAPKRLAPRWRARRPPTAPASPTRTTPAAAAGWRCAACPATAGCSSRSPASPPSRAARC